jgi:DNA-binding transcriptional LysR family regulator
MDRFTEAEMFVRTVEAGSITAAAEALNVDKSAVSRRLKALETRLGVRLLTRSTRTLSLTDAGRTYYARAQDLLRAWREMEDDASGTEGALAGPLRIAAPLSFGLSHLAPVLIDFQTEHSAIRLDVDFSDRKIDLVAEGFDIAVRIGRLDDSTLIARKLGEVRMICAASPDWINAHGPFDTMDDLDGADGLRYGLRSTQGFSYRTPKGDRKTLQLDPIMRASNGDFLVDAAIAGHGVVVQPDFILCDAVRDGALVPLFPDHIFDAPSVYAVWPQSRHMPRRVRALVNCLATRFGGTAPWSLDAQLNDKQV